MSQWQTIRGNTLAPCTATARNVLRKGLTLTQTVLIPFPKLWTIPLLASSTAFARSFLSMRSSIAASASRIDLSRSFFVNSGSFASGCHSLVRTDRMRNKRVVAVFNFAIAVFKLIAPFSSSTLGFPIFNFSRSFSNKATACSLTISKDSLRPTMSGYTLFTCLRWFRCRYWRGLSG